MAAVKPVFLIWGGEGWVAGHLKALLESQGKSFRSIPAHVPGGATET